MVACPVLRICVIGAQFGTHMINYCRWVIMQINHFIDNTDGELTGIVKLAFLKYFLLVRCSGC